MKKRISGICLALAVMISLTTPTFAASAKRPTLTSVSVSDGILNAEDMEYDYAVTVTAKGSDSDIEHITVQFENEANGNTANLVLRAADRTGEDTYAGTLSISAYAQEGTYRLIKVTLQEKDGDYRYYCQRKDLPDDPGDEKKALPKDVSLKLNSGVSESDGKAPVLDGCAVTRSRVLKETAAELHLQVTETGSGIDYVKARFLGDNGRGISLTLTPADGEYVGYLSASQLKYEGTYTLQRVMLKDRAGNRSVLTGFETIRIEVVSEPAFKEAAA